MKKLMMTFFVMTLVVACGKSSNKVNSANPAVVTPPPVTGTNAIMPSSNLLSFEGVYDLIPMDAQDCGASIRIESRCNGYILTDNVRDRPEEFCNVNRGVQPNRRDHGMSSPPNPDRNPPNPDDTENAVVTQEGNRLMSVLKMYPRLVFTNVLTLDVSNGVLVKESNLKSRVSRCVYQKR